MNCRRTTQLNLRILTIVPRGLKAPAVFVRQRLDRAIGDSLIDRNRYLGWFGERTWARLFSPVSVVNGHDGLERRLGQTSEGEHEASKSAGLGNSGL